MRKLEKLFLLYSALQKAVRWGDVHGARHFAREVITMGQPGAVLKRMVVIAAEDVGLADPTLVDYVGQRYSEFEKWEKKAKIKRGECFGHPKACSIIDRAVIAAALSYKSRLLPMISFATLYNICKHETFRRGLKEYQERFLFAVRHQDEKRALYFAYIIKEVFGADKPLLKMIRDEKKTRNAELINEWIKAYEQRKERLLFVGVVLLSCRVLESGHGEYQSLVNGYVSQPIEKADIPDRAYDVHTVPGKRKKRGLKHFLSEAVSLRNERFPNNWQERGKRAYFRARRNGLGRTGEIIDIIKDRYEKRQPQ